MMKLIAINIGQQREITHDKKPVSTGIFKQPASGPATITQHGVVGDTIVDTSVHGGLDQAVYLYSQADYDWWSENLSREFGPGSFGENLTLAAFPEEPLKIGDRLTINDVTLEITAPRIPCFKLANKMGDPKFAKRFVAAVRPGAYARVLTEGVVTAGDTLSWHPTTEDFATVNEIFVEWHKKDWSRTLFEKSLRSPISSIAAGLIEKRLQL